MERAARQAARTAMDLLAWDDMREVRPELAAEVAEWQAAQSSDGLSEVAFSVMQQELERWRAAEAHAGARDRVAAASLSRIGRVECWPS